RLDSIDEQDIYHVIKAFDFEAFKLGYKAPAKSLQKYLHYTDKTYARRLIQVIESNDLTNYD
ncbi:heat-inducible transcriptional repressor HrcA, partial [Streptococcus pyogenes]